MFYSFSEQKQQQIEDFMLRSNKKLEDIKKKLIPISIKKLLEMKGKGRKRSGVYQMLFQNVEEPEQVAMLLNVLIKISSQKCIQFVSIFKKRMKGKDELYWGNLYKALEGISCFGLKEHALFIVECGNGESSQN